MERSEHRQRPSSPSWCPCSFTWPCCTTSPRRGHHPDEERRTRRHRDRGATATAAAATAAARNAGARKAALPSTPGAAAAGSCQGAAGAAEAAAGSAFDRRRDDDDLGQGSHRHTGVETADEISQARARRGNGRHRSPEITIQPDAASATLRSFRPIRRVGSRKARSPREEISLQSGRRVIRLRSKSSSSSSRRKRTGPWQAQSARRTKRRGKNVSATTPKSTSRVRRRDARAAHHLYGGGAARDREHQLDCRRRCDAAPQLIEPVFVSLQDTGQIFIGTQSAVRPKRPGHVPPGARRQTGHDYKRKIFIRATKRSPIPTHENDG